MLGVRRESGVGARLEVPRPDHRTVAADASMLIGAEAAMAPFVRDKS